MNATKQLDVVGICGSLRRDSFNRKALRAAQELMPQSMTMQAVEIGDLPMYNFDLHQSGFPAPVTHLYERIKAADGVLIATPEHNGSIPAALKNVIDWMSRFKPPPFVNMPCAVLSASPGPLGGGRVQYDLRRSMMFVQALFMLQPEVFIAYSPTKFDENGRFTDEVGRQILAQQMAAFHEWILRIRSAFPAPA
jgi:chromate reductase